MPQYAGNMRRANHGAANLSVNDNQDTRVAHQIRQVQRRELRKGIAEARAKEARAKAPGLPPAMSPKREEPPLRKVVRNGKILYVTDAGGGLI